MKRNNLGKKILFLAWLIVFLIIAGGAVYFVKSKAGIDLFPDEHLSDLWRKQ